MMPPKRRQPAKAAFDVTPIGARCPKCGSRRIQWLEDMSTDSSIDFYRCRRCDERWSIRRDGSQS
ncbi:MAG: hypothetical protein IT184_12710 [Acidobacteria bacterium]|nr:hypothetical protein [Acidobacteriota bacterium]